MTVTILRKCLDLGAEPGHPVDALWCESHVQSAQSSGCWNNYSITVCLTVTVLKWLFDDGVSLMCKVHSLRRVGIITASLSVWQSLLFDDGVSLMCKVHSLRGVGIITASLSVWQSLSLSDCLMTVTVLKWLFDDNIVNFLHFLMF